MIGFGSGISSIIFDSILIGSPSSLPQSGHRSAVTSTCLSGLACGLVKPLCPIYWPGLTISPSFCSLLRLRPRLELGGVCGFSYLANRASSSLIRALSNSFSCLIVGPSLRVAQRFPLRPCSHCLGITVILYVFSGRIALQSDQIIGEAKHVQK
jgi:hypothetical protein